MESQQNEHQKLLDENNQGQNQIEQNRTESILNEKGDFDDALAAAEKDYQVYPYRFVVVTLYMMASLAISIQQNTYAPQGAQLQIIYGVPAIEITMTSLIHMILHAPVSIPANYIVDKYGIKIGIIISAILCIIGSWIRCLVNVGGFGWCLVGQGFVGVANPFVINSLNKVSSTWFYPANRAGVTSFLSFFSTITGLLGLLMPGIWFAGFTFDKLIPSDDPDSPYQLKIQEGKDLTFNLNLTQAIIISCLMIPNLIFFKESPPTAPCFTSNVEKEEFSVAVKQLSKNRDYLIQCITFSIFYGSFTILAVILTYILQPFNLGDPLNSAVLACLPIISGIVGCVLSSKYLQRTQKYKKTLIICQIGSIVSLCAFMCLLPTELLGLVIPPVFLVGFFIVPLIPTMLEFSCETNFPIGEATTTGFIFAISHIFSGALGLAMTSLVSPKKGASHKEMQIRSISGIATIAGMFGLSLILFLYVKENLKRLKAEKERKFDKKDDNSTQPTQEKQSSNSNLPDSDSKSAYSGSEKEDNN